MAKKSGSSFAHKHCERSEFLCGVVGTYRAVNCISRIVFCRCPVASQTAHAVFWYLNNVFTHSTKNRELPWLRSRHRNIFHHPIRRMNKAVWVLAGNYLPIGCLMRIATVFFPGRLAMARWRGGLLTHGPFLNSTDCTSLAAWHRRVTAASSRSRAIATSPA